jgi:adenosylmethionine-8-amino-7-oxononanoate aminotransferase
MPKSAFSKNPYSAAADTIWQQDKDHFLHPWTVFDTFGKDGALAIARADGVYLEDTAGNQYLDAVGGLWCTNIGLGRQEMADAIATQVMEMAYASPFVDMTNVPAAQLAAKLATLAPGDLNHVFFTTGGSTAVDSAYRLIQYYQACRGKPEKEHVISLVNSYHGSTYLSMSLGAKKGDHPPEFGFKTDTIHHVSAPNYYRAPRGLTEQEFLEQLVNELEARILEIGADKVAAFFAEPVMGAGGVIVPPAGYHQRTRDLCTRYDVLYVADEVVTSFGRLGHWFASKEVFGVQPDIITTAKGLSSGYLPIGAVLFSDQIHATISEEGHGRCFANGFTYSGHPVACAAALKNIEIMEREQLFENVHDVGPYFEAKLKTLMDLEIVGDVRGTKLMMCVEFVKNKETRELFPEEMDIGKIVSNHADARGLIVRPVVNLNVMSPPLILTRENVDFIVSTLRASIVAAQEELQAA